MVDVAQNIKSVNLDSDIIPEQIKLLYGHLPIVFIINLFTSTVLTTILWNSQNDQVLLVWLALIYAMTFLRFFFTVRFNNLTKDDLKISKERMRRWGVAAVIFSGISGCIWGSAGVLFFDTSTPEAIIFLSIVLTGMTAGSVSSLSTYLPTYAAYSIPTMGPFAIRCIYEGLPEFTAIGILAIFFVIVNIGFATKVQKSVIGFIRLKFENLELIDQLKIENDRAEKASSDKSKFIAATSHDLRQPLNALRLFVGALHHEKLSPKAHKIAEDIEHSSKALSDMLNAVLDISKLDASTIEPQILQFPVQSTLDRAVRDHAARAVKKGIDLRVVPSAAYIQSDPHLLNRIIANLVSNACRYTKSGSILIGCRPRGDDVVIEVWDTGIGMLDGDIKEIFNEYKRLPDGNKMEESGLGLGLAIVRSLAKTLDHEVCVKSVHGKGSVFSIRVPRGVEQPSKAVAPAEDIMSIDGVKLLIIDDDKFSRSGISEITKHWGCEVEAVSSADTALALINSNAFRPDIIISDYRLGDGKTGVQAIAAVRALLGESIPATLISGDTGNDLTDKAKKAGLPVLHKPVSPAKLRSMTQFLATKFTRDI